MADNAFRVEVVERLAEIPKEVEMTDLGEEVAREEFVKFKFHNFSALKDIKKHYLEHFDLAGKVWRLLIFPMGNQVDSVSLYLDFVGPREGKWATCAQFTVALYSEDGQVRLKEAHHRFTEDEIDWGFTQFVPKKVFYNDEKGKRLLVDDVVTLGIAIKIMKDPTGILWHNFINYDSKAETGYLGLKNQGATCYMNSILQSLFFTKYLRRAVFRLPTDDDEPAKSIPLALQRVFYYLQYGDRPVGTTELTKSFGWDAIDSFMQHDVQEFNRVLCDKLETKMKGTPVEGTINFLLEGKMKSYVRCTQVDYESSREESFYDVQLNVKGLKTLRDSFQNYIQVETLDGDNKYFAEGHGLQEAKKGVVFKKLPPVLHLQLKRFEYDMHKDSMVKINDRYEFPEVIDLNEFLEESDQKEPQVYHLHGVLVHSGDLHGGHYCAFLRPEKDGDWFKFDDDRVTRCLKREAMDENFGIDPEVDKPKDPAKPISRYSKKFTNAYMLVYFRESQMDKILCPVDETDISLSTRDRFLVEQQLEEQRKKEKEEQHLYMPVRLVTQSIAKSHHLTDLCLFDTKTESPSSALTLRVKKDMPFVEFKNLVKEKTGIPIEKQRLWSMAKRQNGTIRPDECLEPFVNKTVSEVKEYVKADLRVFVEESTNEGDTDLFEAYNPESDIILIIKSYDPRNALLQYEGSFILKRNERPIDLAAKINVRAGRAANHPLRAYEEVRPSMIEKVKIKETFQRLEIGNGDILCFAEELSPEEVKDLPLPNPTAYYDQILNGVSVLFKDRNAPKDLARQFHLPLSKKMQYATVNQLVAEKLGVPPQMIRFVSHNIYSEGPRQEFKYEPQRPLLDLLQPNTYQPMSEILYYEILEIPITELETKKPVVVTWINSKLVEEGTHKILVDKNGTVEDLLKLFELKLKTPAPSSPNAPNPVGSPKDEDVDVEMGDANDAEEGPTGKYRLFEVFNNRISKVFADDEPVKYLNDYSSFYIEEIPRDQLQLAEGDQLVHCFHFHKDPYSSHGVPFVFRLREDEPFKDAIQRLQKRLSVPDKEFEKYKLATVSYGKTKYLGTEDDVILGNIRFGPNDFLGLDHPDKAPKQSRGHFEKAIVIRN